MNHRPIFKYLLAGFALLLLGFTASAQSAGPAPEPQVHIHVQTQTMLPPRPPKPHTNSSYGNAEANKTYSRSYTLTSGDKIDLTNVYGKVHITTTPTQAFAIQVTVNAHARSLAEAQAIIDRVQTDEIKLPGLYKYATSLTGDRSWNNHSSGFEINYNIVMPQSNSLKLADHYCDSYLDDFNGPLEVSDKYGSMKMGRITNPNAIINMSYGSMDISYLKSAQLGIQYGDCSLYEAGLVQLWNGYGEVKIENVGVLELKKASYGELKVKNVDQVSGNASYTEINIGKLTRSLVLDTRYVSDLEVEQIATGFREINLSGTYSDYKLNFAPGTSFNFNTHLNYGDMHYDDDQVHLKEHVEENNHSSFVGTFGRNPNPAARVVILNTYGDVSFDVSE